MGEVIELHDAFAIRCECGNKGMMLLRSGKVRCDDCSTEWTNLTWSCRDCAGDEKCCRNGTYAGVPGE